MKETKRARLNRVLVFSGFILLVLQATGCGRSGTPPGAEGSSAASTSNPVLGTWDFSEATCPNLSQVVDRSVLKITYVFSPEGASIVSHNNDDGSEVRYPMKLRFFPKNRLLCTPHTDPPVCTDGNGAVVGCPPRATDPVVIGSLEFEAITSVGPPNQLSLTGRFQKESYYCNSTHPMMGPPTSTDLYAPLALKFNRR